MKSPIATPNAIISRIVRILMRHSESSDTFLTTVSTPGSAMLVQNPIQKAKRYTRSVSHLRENAVAI